MLKVLQSLPSPTSERKLKKIASKTSKPLIFSFKKQVFLFIALIILNSMSPMAYMKKHKTYI